MSREGFDRKAVFDAVTQDQCCKTETIGEPRDIGPGGYPGWRLFPQGWGEWNDKYRDTVRGILEGDNVTNDFATRLLGSGDLYGCTRPSPTVNVNFITAMTASR